MKIWGIIETHLYSSYAGKVAQQNKVISWKCKFHRSQCGPENSRNRATLRYNFVTNSNLRLICTFMCQENLQTFSLKNACSEGFKPPLGFIIAKFISSMQPLKGSNNNQINNFCSPLLSLIFTLQKYIQSFFMLRIAINSNISFHQSKNKRDG